MKKNITQTLKILVLGFILSYGIGITYAAWVGPSQGPTGGNAPAPINVSAVSQGKSGGLTVGTFVANSVTALNALNCGSLKTNTSGFISCGTGGTGTVTSLSAGTGITLTPNPITTTGTISADTSVLQQRVSGTCAAGQAIRIINSTGTVTCETVGGAGADSDWQISGTNMYSIPSGNVGIGNTSPQAKLHIGVPDPGAVVVPGIRLSANSTTVGAGTSVDWITSSGGTFVGAQIAGVRNGSNAQGELRFSTSNNGVSLAERMRIGTTGNLGIGTTNPLQPLSITSSATGPKISLWDNGSTANMYGFGVSSGQLNYHVDTTGASHVFYAGGTNSNGTELARIAGNGRVGIGTASPSAKLHVVGDIMAQGKIYPKGEGVGEYIASGVDDGIGDWGLSFRTGYASRMYIANNGNVGIGTTVPGGMLDIVKTHSSGTSQEMFRTAFDGNWGLRLVQNYVGAGDIKYELKEKYAGTEYDVLAFKAGNVGIGITSPSQKLDVNGYVKATGFCIGATTCITSWPSVGTSQWTDGASGSIYRSTGNVGIGTTNPSEKLVVQSGNASTAIKIIPYNDTTKSASIIMENETLRFRTAAPNNGSISFDTPTGNDRMTITRAGNVGIGTNNPGYPLHVKGLGYETEVRIEGAGGVAQIVLDDVDDGSKYWLHNNGDALYFLWNGGAGATGYDSTRPMAIAYGNVGIGGYPSASEQLTISPSLTEAGISIYKAGNTHLPYTDNWNYISGNGVIFRDLSSVERGRYTASSGTFSVSAGGAFVYSSDESLKENIVSIPNALEGILGLNGVTFNWKEGGKKDIGLIAQDVERVFPEFVYADKETGLKSVDYAGLVAPLIEAVKEQQTQIDELRAEIKFLEEGN